MSGVAGRPEAAGRPAAEWAALGVVCPCCRGALEDGAEETLDCAACGRRFPLCHGIPDLRTVGDPYLSADEDRAAAARLAARVGRLDFAALYASYYEGNDKVPPAQVAQFTRGVLAAAERSAASVDAWQALGRPAPRGTATLDLGCGTAPLATLLARRGDAVVGVDAGMRWLVMARARAAAEGVDLPVVCANAEALPFRDGAFGRVASESVLENLHDPDAGVRESRRVLVEDGACWLTTANRLSLAPDPHLGVLAGGWWPESRLRAHAARTGKVFPRRRLHSAGELARVLEDAGFGDVRIATPRIAPAQRAGLPAPLRAAVDGYHLAQRLPGARALLLRIGPTMLCTATAR